MFLLAAPREQKVRTRFLAAPLVSGTLEKLVENEARETKRTASEGLLWLLRCVILLVHFHLSVNVDVDV